MEQLILVQNKYKQALEALNNMDKEEKEALIPLTESVYVKANVASENFLIDIGTNYYIKQTREESIDFYKKKIEFIGNQIASLETIMAQQRLMQQEQLLQQQAQKQGQAEK